MGQKVTETVDERAVFAEERLRAERDTIMRAAHRLIGRGGGSTPIEDILREARVNRRIFYRHFKSKDELILQMQRLAAGTLGAALRSAVDAAETGRAAAIAWIDTFLSIGWDERRAREGRTFVAPEVGLVAGIAEALENIHDEHRRILVDALSGGVADGSLPASQPERDAFAIHAVVLRCVDMRTRGRLRRPFSDVRDEIVDLFLP